MGRERCKSKRVARLQHASIVSLTDAAIIDCKLNDISATGARIWVEHADLVPDYFKLRVPKAPSIPRCRVRWRSGNELGLEFFGPK